MTTPHSPNNPSAPNTATGRHPANMTSDDRDRFDLLITRIVDSAGSRSASQSDWEAFSHLAEVYPHAWQELAQTQRDHQALALAVNMRIHAADGVGVPVRSSDGSFVHSGEDRRVSRSGVLARVGGSVGWLAAACVAIAWFGSTRNVAVPSAPSGVNQAGLVQVGSPDDAINAYLDMGKKQNIVVGEVPQRVLVESRPAGDGKMEVLYLRQFLERATVSDLAKLVPDEGGQLRPMPVRMPAARMVPASGHLPAGD